MAMAPMPAATAAAAPPPSVSERNKVDLPFVSNHRTEVADMRCQLEDLQGRTAGTPRQIELIESAARPWKRCRRSSG